MEEGQCKVKNNLTALYNHIGGIDDEPIVWSPYVIDVAQILQKQVNHLNRVRFAHTYKVPHKEGASPELKIGDEYNSIAVDGSDQKLNVPDLHPDQKHVVAFHGIVELSTLFDTNGDLKGERSKAMPLFQLGKLNFTDHRKFGTCARRNDDPKVYQCWQKAWNLGTWCSDEDFVFWRRQTGNAQEPLVWERILKSDLTEETPDRIKDSIDRIERQVKAFHKVHIQLTSLLEKYAKNLEVIDSIVCFALGPPDCTNPRSFIQHLAAKTIRNTLDMGKGDRRTPIFAQDPEYCYQCREMLSGAFKMEIFDDLSGFEKLSQNSFVIMFAPTNPINGMVIDYLYRKNGKSGPAAMLCDEIDEAFMLPEVKPDASWIDSTPTKNLVEWKKMCFEEYCGDDLDLLGMPWKDYSGKYPSAYANMPENTPEQKLRKDEVKRLCQANANIVFRNACLYVRKD